MDKRQLSLKIKAEAKNLGFFACGIAKARLWTRMLWIRTANGLTMASMLR